MGSQKSYIVLWKLKRPSGLTGPVAEEALSKAKAAIANLKNVPGLETLQLGPPMIEGRNQGFDWGLYSVFASAEALQKYAVSEAHVDVLSRRRDSAPAPSHIIAIISRLDRRLAPASCLPILVDYFSR